LLGLRTSEGSFQSGSVGGGQAAGGKHCKVLRWGEVKSKKKVCLLMCAEQNCENVRKYSHFLEKHPLLCISCTRPRRAQ
jgi:hypothetical protein